MIIYVHHAAYGWSTTVRICKHFGGELYIAPTLVFNNLSSTPIFRGLTFIIIIYMYVDIDCAASAASPHMGASCAASFGHRFFGRPRIRYIK